MERSRKTRYFSNSVVVVVVVVLAKRRDGPASASVKGETVPDRQAEGRRQGRHDLVGLPKTFVSFNKIRNWKWNRSRLLP